MNGFDLSILHFVNAFAQHSIAVDELMWFLTRNVLALGGVSFFLFWYAWFQRSDARSESQEFLLFGFVAAIVSLAVARVLASGLPFRLRPLHDASVPFRLPYGSDLSALMNWSSFPSDHATVFFGLAATLVFVSRPLGGVALFHAIFVVSLPRIYCGIHYPTDVIAGAFLGIGIACLCQITSLRKAVTAPLLHWREVNAGAFYAVLFLCTFEVAELFNSVRTVVTQGLRMASLF